MMRSSVLSGEYLRQEISARGYAEVEQSITDDDLLAAVDAYAHFTLNFPDPKPSTMDSMLPSDNDTLHKKLDDLDYNQDHDTMWHKYRTNTPGIGKPDGYANRTYQERALLVARGLMLGEDPKEFYHYTPQHLTNMESMHKALGWGPIPPEVYTLEAAMAVIHQKAGELMLRVLGTIAEIHPEISGKVTPHSLQGSPLRLLFYHNRLESSEHNDQGDTNIIAGGHYDKGFATIQIGESHEGLEIAPAQDAELTHVVRDANKAVFFPAVGLSDLVGPSSSFQKAWHRVTASEKANPDRSIPPIAQEFCQRWAFVLFSHCEGMTFPDKSLMHTR